VHARKDKLILVAGATGYVGGRLVPRLLQAGYRVRCLVRRPTNLRQQLLRPLVECVPGDVLRPETLPAAMEGVATVYYLIHSMESGKDFEEQDLVAARQCAKAAKARGVQRIIYLGGLGDPVAKLSAHLRSRQETGKALREAGVPVTEFRAAVVIGAGSLSFELIRYLSERLPVMICPLWVYTRIQPIAISERAGLPGRRAETAREHRPDHRDRRRGRRNLRRIDGDVRHRAWPETLPIARPHFDA
jgi:uncharacterized protein YbjT (DUF2867 family)